MTQAQASPRSSADDSAEEREVPPDLDFSGHLRNLRRAALPAIVAGILVGLLVLIIRLNTEPRFESTVFTRIEVTSADNQTTQLAQAAETTFSRLAQNSDVAEAIRERTQDAEGSGAPFELALAVQRSPTMLAIKVTSSNAAYAQAVAVVATEVLNEYSANIGRNSVRASIVELTGAIADARADGVGLRPDDPDAIIAEQTVLALNQQLERLRNVPVDRLTVISSPTGPGEKVSPRPVSEAVVAALVAMILVAEGIVLIRSLLNKRVDPSWARRMSRRHRASFVTASGDYLPDSTAYTAALRTLTGKTVLVLNTKEVPLKVISALPGYGDATPSGGRVVAHDVGSLWWTDATVTDVSFAAVVAGLESRRDLVESAVAALVSAGVPTQVVLVGVSKYSSRHDK